MSPTQGHGWILYSPSAPTEIEAPTWGEDLCLSQDDLSVDGFHQGGWFLPEAQRDGWRFGVSQERLSNGRVHAFLRTPAGEELSVVLDHRESGARKLNVPQEPGYLGAALVGVAGTIASRSALVQALLSGLPGLKLLLSGEPPSKDA